jgi:hypothetical protein
LATKYLNRYIPNVVLRDYLCENIKNGTYEI